MKITMEIDTNDPMDLEMVTRMFAPMITVTSGTALQHVKDVAEAAEALKDRPDLTEADRQVDAAIALKDGSAEAPPVIEEKPKVTKKTTRKKKSTTKKKEEPELDVMPKKKETSAAAAVTVEDEAPPAEEAAPAAEPPGQMTLKDVRDAFTKYVKQTSLETASKVLDDFEIKRVSDLEPSNYVDFFEAIRANG